MSARVGILVFSRSGSRRLPGKALRPVGSMPLLERVLRRAQLCSVPVYLATTDRGRDDALAGLAASLGVASFRGSEDRVLERAVRAAESFGLDGFVRLCGDRPLFPLADVERAVTSFVRAGAEPPDLITSHSPEVTARGLTTELIRTPTLRTIMDRGVSAEQQEHVTPYFYDNPGEFRIVDLPNPPSGYSCPGFAVDTEADLTALNAIFAIRDDLDLTAEQADRIYRR
jgi:spore coat polysaccharide biosynthesis protein SpsF